MITSNLVKQGIVLIKQDGSQAVKLITKAQGRDASGNMTYETVQQMFNRNSQSIRDYFAKGYKFDHITTNIC